MLQPTNLHTTPHDAARSVGPQAPMCDGQLADDYGVCREYALVRARGFGTVRDFLPAARQPYCDAHVALIMYTDDLVDDVESTSAQREVRFEHWRWVVLAAQDGRADGDGLASSLSRAFAHTAATWGIAAESVRGYLDGSRATSRSITSRRTRSSSATSSWSTRALGHGRTRSTEERRQKPTAELA